MVSFVDISQSIISTRSKTVLIAVSSRISLYSFTDEGLRPEHQAQFESHIASSELVANDGELSVWLGFSDGQVKLLRRVAGEWTQTTYLSIPWPRATVKPSGPVAVSGLSPGLDAIPNLVTLAWMSGHISIGWLEGGNGVFRVLYSTVTPDTLFQVCSHSAFVTVTAHNGFTYLFTFSERSDSIETKAFSFNSSLVLGYEAVKLFSTCKSPHIV